MHLTLFKFLVCIIYIYINLRALMQLFNKIDICTRDIWHTEGIEHLVYTIDMIKL